MRVGVVEVLALAEALTFATGTNALTQKANPCAPKK